MRSNMASPLGIPLPPSEWKRQNPPKGPNFDWEMYRYVPSLAGAIVCLVVFLVMAFLHLYQYLRSRNRIIIFVVIGALCMSSLLLLVCQLITHVHRLELYLTECNRRGRWLRRAYRIALRQRCLAPVHHPRCTDTRRSSMVCCNHIHDAWPYDQTCWWRRCESDPSEVVHKDLRHRGRHDLDHSGPRYVVSAYKVD